MRSFLLVELDAAFASAIHKNSMRNWGDKVFLLTAIFGALMIGSLVDIGSVSDREDDTEPSGSDDENNSETNLDLLLGDNADNWIGGESNDEKISGLAGDDYLTGGGGKDVLLGGDGDDFLAGEGNNDVLVGGEGNDFLVGSVDAQVNESTSDSDHLDGGIGNDLLIGGSGDILLGGEGNDVFVAGEWAVGHDAPTIEDFDPAKDTLLIFVDEGSDGSPDISFEASGSSPVRTTVFIDDIPAAFVVSETELDSSDIKLTIGKMADAYSLGDDGRWR